MSPAGEDLANGELRRRDAFLLGDTLDRVDERDVVANFLLLEAGRPVTHIAGWCDKRCLSVDSDQDAGNYY